MRKLLYALFVLAISLTAQANTITYSDSITGLFDLVPNRDLVVPQFDSSLGTLNSVTMDISTAIQASLGFENLKKFAGGNFDISASVHGYVVVSSMIMSNFVDSQTYTITLQPYDGILDYAGTSGTTVATYSDVDNGIFTQTSDFARFIGTGSVPFNIMTDARADHFGLPANSSATINTTAQASVSVTYDYTPVPVPEPATIAILSFAGLLLKRKTA
jgi:hypothetical protein